MAHTSKAQAAPQPAFIARPIHGVVLAMLAWLTVIASGILSPVLPKIAAHFAAEPNLELKIGFVATMPALAVALLALAIGTLADRVGHRRVLLIGLIAYGVAGIAPFWIDSLDAIIFARFLVGVGEAAAMAMSTALIAMYFEGARRRRWLAIQVASANVAGVLTLFAGGFIGRLSWRAPFLAYSFALLLFVLVVVFIRRPSLVAPHSFDDAGRAESALGAANAARSVDTHSAGGVPVDVPGNAGLSGAELRAVLAKCALLMVVTLSIAVIIIELAFLLTERGVSDPAALGLGIGGSAAGIAVGASFAGTLVRAQPRQMLAIGYGLIGIGFIIMAQPISSNLTVGAGFIAGLGCGTAIPSLLAATFAETRAANMGTVSGLWTTAVFIGQFAAPPVILLLKSLTGSLANAILIVGIAAAAMSAVVQITGVGMRTRAAVS